VSGVSADRGVPDVALIGGSRLGCRQPLKPKDRRADWRRTVASRSGRFP